MDGRRTVALACRILAHAGLAEDVLGHVSLRVGPDRLLVRCRGPQERGLLFTHPDDVHEVDLTGAGDLPPGYAVPAELPIHTALLRARAEVGAVVHAHPPSVVVADLAGVPLRALVGAYNIPAARMAAAGVPVHPRSVLISRPDLAAELLASMGGASACVLRGHGIVTTGEDVASAVIRALNLDVLARMSLAVVRAGGIPAAVPDADLAELPDLGPGLNEAAVWRYRVAQLERAGLAAFR